jgi:hypothetical protein
LGGPAGRESADCVHHPNVALPVEERAIRPAVGHTASEPVRPQSSIAEPEHPSHAAPYNRVAPSGPLNVKNTKPLSCDDFLIRKLNQTIADLLVPQVIQERVHQVLAETAVQQHVGHLLARDIREAILQLPIAVYRCETIPVASVRVT